MPTMGSLFAGIGGFDLGFERAGFETVWQVEIDEYCRKVLAKNFPKAERYGDIRECGAQNLRPVDVICGGFPCQDISNAGLRAGIDGERSGLWAEMFRIISELRPKVVVVENVAALLGRGISKVLGDLSEIGYDAEWEVISAADMGAPHLRKRVWIVAYPGCKRFIEPPAISHSPQDKEGDLATPQQGWRPIEDEAEPSCEDVADPTRFQQRREKQRSKWQRSGESCQQDNGSYSENPYGRWPDATQHSWWWHSEAGGLGKPAGGQEHWLFEPNVGRVAHGIPARVDRLKGLGNAVVPQIPEMIARAIKPHLDEMSVGGGRKKFRIQFN